MRLKKLQDYLNQKGWNYQYAEEDGCGSVDWDHRGLAYHVWEFEGGAESNVRMAGRMEDYSGDYEEQILAVIREWG